jgi:hypothetical protein
VTHSDPRPEDTGTWSGVDRRRPHPMPLGRRLLMLAIIFGVLGGFTLLVWLAVDVRQLTTRGGMPTAEELARAAHLLRVLAIVMSVSVVGVATWIGHFAWRVRKNEVYPPPGSRHLRVKRVLRGDEARRVSTVLFTIAGILALAGVSLMPLVLRFLASLGLSRY